MDPGAFENPILFLRLPITTDRVIDLRLLGIAAILGFGSAIVLGLAPAILASMRDPMTDLKNPKPQWGWGRLRFTPRQGLLICQVALAVMLAVVSGLYARSFWQIASLDSNYVSPIGCL